MFGRQILLTWALLAFSPMQAWSQWGTDPAQAGAMAYCATRNQGLSTLQADQAATQAMAEIIQLSSGPVQAGLQLNSPALVARLQNYVGSLCPDSASLDNSGSFDDGLKP